MGTDNGITSQGDSRNWPRAGTQVVAEPPTFGPKERLLIAFALAGILIWGFSGDWEYPTLDTSSSAASPAAPTPVATGPSASQGGARSAGAELFQANGCPACHALDGGQALGPSLIGIFGQGVDLADGSKTRIDDAYLIESILAPEAKRVAGHDQVAMPSYADLLSDEDARSLVEYIKSLE